MLCEMYLLKNTIFSNKKGFNGTINGITVLYNIFSKLLASWQFPRSQL